MSKVYASRATLKRRYDARTYSGFGKMIKSNKASTGYKKRKFNPGYDRTGGYYGRFNGKGGEYKFFDTQVNVVPAPALGFILPSLNLVVQGITEDTRVGRKMTIKSINWHMQAATPTYEGTVDPGQGDALRVILYLDKQCNGAAAGVTDILESAGWQEFRNLAENQRFDILMDKTIDINPGTLASFAVNDFNGVRIRHSSSFFKKCNIPIEYNGPSGLIGTIRSNNLGVLIIAANGTADFISKVRIRYSDY